MRRLLERVPAPLQPLARAALWTIGLWLFYALAVRALAGVDLAARALAPTLDPLTLVVVALVFFLLFVRLWLVSLAPALLLFTAIRGVADLLASGHDEPPPPPGVRGGGPRRKAPYRGNETPPSRVE